MNIYYRSLQIIHMIFQFYMVDNLLAISSRKVVITEKLILNPILILLIGRFRTSLIQNFLIMFICRHKELQRWLCCLAIGICIGGVGIFITICIELLAMTKLKILQTLFHSKQSQWAPEVSWVTINFLLVFGMSFIAKLT